MQRDSSALTAIDLFCGAGGLSLGLEKAGFKVVAGLEIDTEVSKTYRANFPNTKLFTQDIRSIQGKDFLNKTGFKSIDLVAGCPPCQGFSSLTNKHRKVDPRNDLVLEMARIIEELQPVMVMMENVPGLSLRGNSILNEFILKLQNMGYLINKDVLQLADYGIPQFRRRFVLLAGRGFEINVPLKTHSNKKDDKLKPWQTLSDVIKKGGRKPITLSQAKKKGGPQKFNWHVVRDLKEISLKRLRALKSGDDRKKLPDNLRPKCHLSRDKGFSNVYGRLAWQKTPPTITSGCTTPAMGRFGHPNQLRTISVREAASIQTFPKSFVFNTDVIGQVCGMVGNALPSQFARILAESCVRVFTKEVVGDEKKYE